MARTVVTLETERIKLVQSLMFMMMILNSYLCIAELHISLIDSVYMFAFYWFFYECLMMFRRRHQNIQLFCNEEIRVLDGIQVSGSILKLLLIITGNSKLLNY